MFCMLQAYTMSDTSKTPGRKSVAAKGQGRGGKGTQLLR